MAGTPLTTPAIACDRDRPNINALTRESALGAYGHVPFCGAETIPWSLCVAGRLLFCGRVGCFLPAPASREANQSKRPAPFRELYIVALPAVSLTKCTAWAREREAIKGTVA